MERKRKREQNTDNIVSRPELTFASITIPPMLSENKFPTSEFM